jgi:hypothetical protein
MKVTPSMAVATGSNSPQTPFLPELELLLAIHPVAAVTVGLVLRLSTAAEGYPVAGLIHTAISGFNRNTAANPDGAFTVFFFVVYQHQ